MYSNKSETMIKHFLSFVIVLFFIGQSQAQFSLAFKYETNKAPEWNDAINAQSSEENLNILSPSMSLHVGYWLKPIETFRWNVIAELGGSMSNHEIDIENELSWTRVDLTINNHIYFLDLEGDCDCPTFKKQGPALSKGFFINLAPGFAYNKFKYDYSGPFFPVDPDPQIETLESSSANFKISIGAGLDIGINELITITPFANYTKRLSTEWSPWAYQGISSENGLSSSVNQTEFGLRTIWRFDYVRKY